MADMKPADVYVGIVELFSVFLPGAILTGALVLAAPMDGSAFSPLLDGEEARWVAFALVAYALGAFVFSIAAELDRPYDAYREDRWAEKPGDAYRTATQLRRKFFEDAELPPDPESPAPSPAASEPAKEGDQKDTLSSRISAALDEILGKDREKGTPLRSLVRAALRLLVGVKPASKADSDDGDRPMNTFSWAKTLLLLRAPGAFAEVQRYEAESKFFRSLVLVLPTACLLAALHWGLTGHIVLTVLSVALALPLARLSFHRYAERRHKSTKWAYSYVIGLQLDSASGE